MKLKLPLVTLLLTTLVACGGPTATPAANAPTTAPTADATTAPAAVTAASADATTAPAADATTAPAADATTAPAAVTAASADATTAPAADATAPAADGELPVAPTETPANDVPTPAAAIGATAAATSQPSGQSNAQCAPGWVRCQTLADPKITIVGSRLVSQDAMDAVARIYTDMTSRFTSAYPKNKFDGYTIYMTNGEPWSELQNLAPIGTMWSGVDEYGVARGDVLRGGTSQDYLWIEEQLMCKRGVATRNAAYAAGKSKQRDDTTRTFDQVIHEFGHAIAFRFGLVPQITQVYRADPKPVERFPWSIQNTFGAPAGKVSDGERAFLNQIFSSSTTYSCDTYALSQVHTVKLEVGKQYAFREANNTFRYFQLTSVNNVGGGGPIRIDLCPKPGQMGWITMADATDLTTVENALAEKLTPKSEPCTPDVAPPGVFTNGTSQPDTAVQNAGQAAATPLATVAAIAPTQAPPTLSADQLKQLNSVKLEVGKQYALREANNTFRYFKLTSVNNRGGAGPIRIDLCPEPGKMGWITMSDAANLTTVENALAEKLTPKSEPCTPDVAPNGVLNNGTSLPSTADQPANGSQNAATAAPSANTGAPNTVARSAPLKLELGKQYVVRQADGTYEYHKLTYQGIRQSNGATFYRGARCPNPNNLNEINILDINDVMTVEGALAAKLTMTNQPCNTTQVPHGS